MNCSAAASHMRRKKKPEAGPASAPAPAGPPPSSQAPPRSLPPPVHRGTMTAPRRPGSAAPPAGTGPGGSNRRHPGPRPRLFRVPERRFKAKGAGARERGGASSALSAYPPFLSLSNCRGARGVCSASDYDSRHATLCTPARLSGAVLSECCKIKPWV
ncbi:uncharacterized protein LOC144367272 [Ictidomys tridecemlineatus]